MQPSVSLLESLGEAGIKAFLEAIQRGTKPQSKDTIQININVPHQTKSFCIDAAVGSTLKDSIENSRILGSYLECACGGIAACSTCHVYIAKEYMHILPPPEEAEMDMLDLAASPNERSRLGCQIEFTEKCAGMVIEIPPGSNNLFGR